MKSGEILLKWTIAILIEWPRAFILVITARALIENATKDNKMENRSCYCYIFHFIDLAIVFEAGLKTCSNLISDESLCSGILIRVGLLWLTLTQRRHVIPTLFCRQTLRRGREENCLSALERMTGVENTPRLNNTPHATLYEGRIRLFANKMEIYYD